MSLLFSDESPDVMALLGFSVGDSRLKPSLDEQLAFVSTLTTQAAVDALRPSWEHAVAATTLEHAFRT
jgi:hypothetical protein